MNGAKSILVGNWKMNGRRESLSEIEAIADAAEAIGPGVEVVVCPPVTLLALAADMLRGRPVMLGAQTVRADGEGAFTGDVNAEMLADAGAKYCIVGHSERRRDYLETDTMVAEKARAAAAAGLCPIVCVGESLIERRAGKALDVIARQAEDSVPDINGSGLIVAYEPVWAIGSGLTPTVKEISVAHAVLRAALGFETRLLYGGSVKMSNAAEIFSARDVDGALVGGASLSAAEFTAILQALATSGGGAAAASGLRGGRAKP